MPRKVRFIEEVKVNDDGDQPKRRGRKPKKPESIATPTPEPKPIETPPPPQQPQAPKPEEPLPGPQPFIPAAPKKQRKQLSAEEKLQRKIKAEQRKTDRLQKQIQSENERMEKIYKRIMDGIRQERTVYEQQQQQQHERPRHIDHYYSSAYEGQPSRIPTARPQHRAQYIEEDEDVQETEYAESQESYEKEPPQYPQTIDPYLERVHRYSAQLQSRRHHR